MLNQVLSIMDTIWYGFGGILLIAFIAFFCFFYWRLKKPDPERIAVEERERKQKERHQISELQRKSDFLSWLSGESSEISDETIYNHVLDILYEGFDASEDGAMNPHTTSIAMEFVAAMCGYCRDNNIALEEIIANWWRDEGTRKKVKYAFIRDLEEMCPDEKN